jgi:hypothetical protein
VYIPLNIDRLFVLWLFNSSGNFIAKIARSFHEHFLSDLARARNRVNRTTRRQFVLLTLYSSAHDQNLTMVGAMRGIALYAPAEFNRLSSETDYLEKTFQIMAPARPANTRPMPST